MVVPSTMYQPSRSLLELTEKVITSTSQHFRNQWLGQCFWPPDLSPIEYLNYTKSGAKLLSTFYDLRQFEMVTVFCKVPSVCIVLYLMLIRVSHIISIILLSNFSRDRSMGSMCLTNVIYSVWFAVYSCIVPVEFRFQ